MGAPIVVNTVKVQGTVASSGVTSVAGTVSQNAIWTSYSPDSSASYVAGTVYSGNVVSNGAAQNYSEKLFLIGGLSDAATWVPLGVSSTSGKLLTESTISGSVETYTNSVSTVSSSEAVQNASSASGFTGYINPIGAVQQVSNQWTFLQAEQTTGALLVSGTVNSNISGTATIPATAPAYVTGTVTSSAANAAYTRGTVTVTNAASGAVYAQGTVSVSGTANTVERGATIAHGSAAISASAQVIGTASGRRSAVLTNLGTDYLWLGASGVAVGGGLRLAPGQTAVIDKAPNAAIFAVASSGTQSIAYFTESD